MAGLDELFNQIPTNDIARKLGADEGEVTNAVHTLVPLLVGGLQQNAQDPDHASHIHDAACSHAASGLLDGGVSVDQVDEADGSKAVAKIFGGNDSSQVAAALSGGGAGNGDLIKRLLPILTPIVLAYLGKQLSNGSAGSGVGEVLGSILGGVLGASQSGGGRGGGLGDILGGLLGAKK